MRAHSSLLENRAVTALAQTWWGAQVERAGFTELTPVSRKHDIKQFRQACKELRLTAEERYAASEALHAEKAVGGMRRHLTYGELIEWLREWRRL